MRARNLPARVAAVEERAGINLGLSVLSDDDLRAAIKAIRGLLDSGADRTDLLIAERATEIYLTRQRRRR